MPTVPEPLGTEAGDVAPRFCTGALCQSSDCCLRRAQSLPALAMSLVAWNAVEVSWSVPEMYDAVFQEYQAGR